MAINYVTSFTFSPNTTISSSQVNTNFSDNTNTWVGLEGGTKTISQIKVDADPTTALQLTTKQYVDHYSTYRRPNLVYNSGSLVNVETGLNGSSGQATILFPDGNIRSDSAAGRIQCNLAQVATYTGTAQSGLQTGTVTTNTWYWIYAVKTSDNSSNFVLVADKTNGPFQASYATLNSNFGSNSWVYLGLIRYGDNSGATGAILSFIQAGHVTAFNNSGTGVLTTSGTRLANTGGGTSLTYTYSAGTGTTAIPANVSLARYTGCCSNASAKSFTLSSTRTYGQYQNANNDPIFVSLPFIVATEGMSATINSGVATGMDIWLSGIVDGVLGVGSNPLL